MGQNSMRLERLQTTPRQYGCCAKRTAIIVACCFKASACVELDQYSTRKKKQSVGGVVQSGCSRT